MIQEIIIGVILGLITRITFFLLKRFNLVPDYEPPTEETKNDT